MQRKGFIRGTCLLLPSSQKSGTQARRKTAPRLNPTQPPQVPVPMLCFSTAPTASAPCHSPAHTPLPLVVPPEQGLQPWCPSGLRPSRSSCSSRQPGPVLPRQRPLRSQEGRSTSARHHLSHPPPSQAHWPTTTTLQQA